MMGDSKNIEKYETYKKMKSDLSKSMKAGFYYEAIFIEYAIMEDRCLSVLKHSGVKYVDNRGWELKLSAKLNKLKSHSAFSNPYIRKRITLEMIGDIEIWKRDRDVLIHNLAKIPYDHEQVKQIAERGQLLTYLLDNKVRSVNRYCDKQTIIENDQRG